MELLDGAAIRDLLRADGEDTLYIDPLLEADQIGAVTVDFRLGYDFLVSIFTRKPVVELDRNNNQSYREISSYYQPTRRDIGDKFILYPHQSVLTTSLEYISLPSHIYLDLISRSSYSRLGIQVSTMVQPGFRGCVPIELYNHGNNALELVVGSRVFQARFFRIGNGQGYLSGGHRKYFGQIRPTASRADTDFDLMKLVSLSHRC